MNSTLILRFLTASLALASSLPLVSGADQKREAPPAQSPAKIDLNSASIKTLAALPAIGPDLAPAIVAARPFASVDDLNRVKGISAERLEQIRAQVMIVPPPGVRDVLAGKASNEPAPQSVPERKKVDLNTADLHTLETTLSIGPELARAIVAARPFKSIDELNRVNGITAEQLEHIRTDAIVRPAPSPAGPEKRTKK